MLTLLFGCAPSPAPEAPALALEDLATGGCGLEPYAWVSLEHMGEILEWEPVLGATLPRDALRALLSTQGVDTSMVEHGIRTWKIRYRTQDRGAPAEATALVAAPDDVGADEALPVVLWTHPTTGFVDECAPSGDELMAIANVAFAGAGFVLVAPDYLGLSSGEPSEELHPYVVPEPTAVVSLDSLRALEALRAEAPELGLPKADGRTVLWGASEGGAAALWADRYAPYYLPELEVTAVVAAVPPTDTPGIARWGSAQRSDATLGIVAYLTTQREWYRATAPLSEVFTDQPPLFLASEAPELLSSSCDLDLPLTGEEEVGDLLTDDFVAAAQSGDYSELQPWGCFVESADLAASAVPRASGAPVLMIVGEQDTLVPGEVERAHAGALCEAGYDLEYLECAGTDHVDTVLSTWDDQLAWVRARLAGEPLVESCVIGAPRACE
jgi:pimeloyl-ACP methyl ester carboxylesterase